MCAVPDLAEDLQLVIKELNVTIDHSFCRSGCQGNNQSYFIPMAPLFGFEPITLQFRSAGGYGLRLIFVINIIHL